MALTIKTQSIHKICAKVIVTLFGKQRDCESEQRYAKLIKKIFLYFETLYLDREKYANINNTKRICALNW